MSTDYDVAQAMADIEAYRDQSLAKLEAEYTRQYLQVIADERVAEDMRTALVGAGYCFAKYMPLDVAVSNDADCIRQWLVEAGDPLATSEAEPEEETDDDIGTPDDDEVHAGFGHWVLNEVTGEWDKVDDSIKPAAEPKQSAWKRVAKMIRGVPT